MNPDHIRKHFEALGWSTDPAGRLCRQQVQHRNGRSVVRHYRITLQARTLRLDCRSLLTSDWIRIGGSYYSKIVKLPDGRLRVGSLLFRATGDR